MGQSRIHYRGRHFDAPDPVLEVWLKLLIDEMDRLEQAPQWLIDARSEWYPLATEQFGFGVVPDLNGRLIDANRCALLRALAERALQRLETFGDPIPADTLNALGAGKPGSGFPRDLPAKLFREPARAFIELLADRAD